MRFHYLLVLSLFIRVFFAEFARAEISDSSVLEFSRGIGFADPYKRFHVDLRFRSQNLLQYESDSDQTDARVTGQPRRLRLRFGGWMVDERLRFNLQLSFSRGDMDWDNTSFPNTIRDAAVMYQILPRLELVYGQTKLPGNRQRVVSSGELQFPDRSIVNRAYNIDRDFGVQARLKGAEGPWTWRMQGAVTTGGGRNTRARDASALALTLRAEVLPWGDFKDGGDYFEGDLAFEEDPRLSVGVGASRFRGVDRAGGTIGAGLASGDRGFDTWMSDAVLKFRGFSLYGEYIQKRLRDWVALATDFSQTPKFGDPVLDGEGLNVQAGYAYRSGWEPVVRYSVVTPETRSIAEIAWQQRQFGVGLNRYLRQHRVKVQADASWNEFTQLGALGGGVGSSGQWAARFQVELGI
ncbi:MAG: porin [Oligoflexia bacterium]